MHKKLIYFHKRWVSQLPLCVICVQDVPNNAKGFSMFDHSFIISWPNLCSPQSCIEPSLLSSAFLFGALFLLVQTSWAVVMHEIGSFTKWLTRAKSSNSSNELSPNYVLNKLLNKLNPNFIVSRVSNLCLGSTWSLNESSANNLVLLQPYLSVGTQTFPNHISEKGRGRFLTKDFSGLDMGYDGHN